MSTILNFEKILDALTKALEPLNYTHATWEGGSTHLAGGYAYNTTG